MIIKGVAGEFYPCKPDIFKATYEAEAPATITHAVTLQVRGKHLIADCEAATVAVSLGDLASVLNIETDRLGRVRH